MKSLPNEGFTIHECSHHYKLRYILIQLEVSRKSQIKRPFRIYDWNCTSWYTLLFLHSLKALLCLDISWAYHPEPGRANQNPSGLRLWLFRVCDLSCIAVYGLRSWKWLKALPCLDIRLAYHHIPGRAKTFIHLLGYAYPCKVFFGI